MILKLIFVCFVAFIAALPSQAQEIAFPSQNYSSNATAPKVTQIIDYKTLLLSDQSVVSLSGLHIPQSAQGSAFEWLEDNIIGQSMKIYRPARSQETPKNRFGHYIAQLVTADQPHIWIQAAMLAQGLALFWPNEYLKDQESADLLQQAEIMARDAKLGLWSDENGFTVAPAANNIASDTFKMQILRGDIRSVSTIGGNTYLNFGDNWRQDFTVMIPSNIRREMSRHNFDPTQLQNKTIEVRGYIENYYGPMIKLHHQAQIRLLTQ